MAIENLLEKKQRFEFWKNHVDLALKSNSISKYCLDNNIKHSTLHGYKKKFYPELSKTLKNKIKKTSTKKLTSKTKAPLKPVFKKIEINNNTSLMNKSLHQTQDKNSPEFAARFLKEFIK